MTHLTRAWNPELAIGVTDLETVLQFSRGGSPLSAHEQTSVGDKHSSVNAQIEAGNQLEHCSGKTTTALEAGKARRCLSATDTVKTKIAVKGADSYVQYSKTKNTIHQILIEYEKKSDSQVAEMAEKMVIDAMEACVVEEQGGCVQSIVSSAICSAIGNVLNKAVGTDHTQSAVIKAVLHHLMIKSVFDALMKGESLMASIAIFVLNYVKNGSNCVEKEKHPSGSKRKIPEVLPSPSSSDLPDDNKICFKNKK